MGHQKVKPLTEGGILAAISVVMALTSIYVPLLGTIVAFIWPLPIIILVVRHGLRWGILASVVSGILIALLIHPMQAISMTVAFGLVGLVIGYNYRQGYGAFKSLLMAMAASIISKIAVLALGALLLNINPMSMQIDIMKEAFSTSIDIYRSSGMSENEIAQLETNFKTGLDTISLLFPIIIVMAGMLDAYINFIVSGRVLRRLGTLDLVTLKPFTQWRFSLWVVYLYAFSLIGMYWGPQLKSDLLFQVSLNANIFANLLGFVQGLTLLGYAADHYKLGKFIRVFGVIVLATNGFFLQVISLTGLFDIIFDIRRRMAARR